MSSVPDTEAFRDERRRRQGKRRVRAVALLVGLVAIVAVGAWAVLSSSLFALTEVRVDGAKVVAADTVRVTASAPMGRSLARVDERTIADRVSTLPPVARVTVKRSWPHALTITVTERTPAYVLDGGGTWTLVDGSGVAYQQMPERPERLVVVKAPNDDTVLAGLSQVVTGLSPQLSGDLEGLEAKSVDSTTLRLKGGRQVFLGSAADVDLKVRVATALFTDTKARWIDVSAPGHPATR